MHILPDVDKYHGKAGILTTRPPGGAGQGFVFYNLRQHCVRGAGFYILCGVKCKKHVIRQTANGVYHETANRFGNLRCGKYPYSTHRLHTPSLYNSRAAGLSLKSAMAFSI
jgi:hypothetical protein